MAVGRTGLCLLGKLFPISGSLKLDFQLRQCRIWEYLPLYSILKKKRKSRNICTKMLKKKMGWLISGCLEYQLNYCLKFFLHKFLCVVGIQHRYLHFPKGPIKYMPSSGSQTEPQVFAHL